MIHTQAKRTSSQVTTIDGVREEDLSGFGSLPGIEEKHRSLLSNQSDLSACFDKERKHSSRQEGASKKKNSTSVSLRNAITLRET